MNLEGYLNDFANRCFRDTADEDYINARLAYRHHLFPQFYWSSLQALEKYLKAILLYNRIEAKKVGHSLNAALSLTERLPFPIRRSETTNELIRQLDQYGRNRYLETSYCIRGPKLVQLDKAVWEVRRYCRALNQRLAVKGRPIDVLSNELASIEAAESRPPHKFRLQGGHLELILAKRNHPARPALIWQNAFYGSRRRKTVRMVVPLKATNSPLTLRPEILDEVLKYVVISKDVERAYRRVPPKR